MSKCFVLFIVSICVASSLETNSTSSSEGPEEDVGMTPEDVRNELIDKGVSPVGAARSSEFLFKDHTANMTADAVKLEFRQFVSSLSKDDQAAIKRIISKELGYYFSEHDIADSIFLIGR